MATAHEHSAHQQSELADTQASHSSLTQALQQQLSAQQAETKAALQQLGGAKQRVAQLQAACQQQSEHVAELEADLAASQGTVASANAELASQTDRTAGTAATLHMHVDAICCVDNNLTFACCLDDHACDDALHVCGATIRAAKHLCTCLFEYSAEQQTLARLLPWQAAQYVHNCRCMQVQNAHKPKHCAESDTMCNIHRGES